MPCKQFIIVFPYFCSIKGIVFPRHAKNTSTTKQNIFMEQHFCQSCGMPLSNEIKGTNADGSLNDDYCVYCYKDGEFTQDFTIDQMIDFCLQFLDQMNAASGWNYTPAQAKKQMEQYFPHLKRWKDNPGLGQGHGQDNAD